MDNEQALKLCKGQKIEVYDGCLQTSVIEPVVRVEESKSYSTVYIYTERDNWIGYDERLSTPEDVRRVVN